MPFFFLALVIQPSQKIIELCLLVRRQNGANSCAGLLPKLLVLRVEGRVQVVNLGSRVVHDGSYLFLLAGCQLHVVCHLADQAIAVRRRLFVTPHAPAPEMGADAAEEHAQHKNNQYK